MNVKELFAAVTAHVVDMRKLREITPYQLMLSKKISAVVIKPFKESDRVLCFIWADAAEYIHLRYADQNDTLFYLRTRDTMDMRRVIQKICSGGAKWHNYLLDRIKSKKGPIRYHRGLVWHCSI